MKRLSHLKAHLETERRTATRFCSTSLFGKQVHVCISCCHRPLVLIRSAENRKKQHIHTRSAFLEYKRCRLPRNGHVWYHPPTASVCPCECMSARSRLELPSSSSEEERRVTEQDTTGNLGERFRLLARQVLRRRRYFSPRECVKFVAKRKTAPPEE
jgi:hypothetical protein